MGYLSQLCSWFSRWFRGLKNPRNAVADLASNGASPAAPFSAPLPTPEILIVGLGNPGQQYAATRHNVGFWIVDRLAERAGAIWREEPTFEALVAYVELHGRTCLLAKPLTFMNRSGVTALAACERWSSLDPTTDLLVLYDDMDLPTGRIRLRPKGGNGGHNGIGDIIEVLATKAISRLRFGVGHPGADGPPVIDWVLSPFAEEEAEVLRAAVDRAADAVGGVVEGGIVSAMGQFNAQN